MIKGEYDTDNKISTIAIALTVVLVAGILSGCTAGTSAGNTATPQASTAAGAATQATVSAGAGSASFSGTGGHLTATVAGEQTTQPFTLEPGAYILKWSGDNPLSFSSILNDKGEVKKGIKTSGENSGENAFGVLSGASYQLKVGSKGTYNVEFIKVDPASGKPAPMTITGTGVAVSDPVKLKAGSASVKYTPKDTPSMPGTCAVDGYNAATGKTVYTSCDNGAEHTMTLNVPEDGTYVFQVWCGRDVNFEVAVTQ